VIENVRGLKGTLKGYFYNKIIEELNSLKYTVTEWTLNANDFEVPQNRHRIFIIGFLKYNKQINLPSASEEKNNVSDAISDLPFLENGNLKDKMSYKTKAKSKYSIKMREQADKKFCYNNLVSKNTDIVIKRYHYIPQGGNWQNIPRKLMQNYRNVNKCHTHIYHRLDENKPSIVLGNFRKNMLIHPTQNRGLSVREAARLQSFPDDFIFYGNIGEQQQQVGNAVPPLLAEEVFKQILRNI
jgi:DNA (cytosine-5)-methyltransferase 1